VGALCALHFADAGLRVAILERSSDALELPRAVGLDGESLRAFQRLGFADEVAALLQAPRENEEVQFTNSRRERLFGQRVPEIGLRGWRDNSWFDQPELEALLRDRVFRDERIEVFLGREARAIEESGARVRTHCVARANGAEETLTSSYVIGCDGASSFVREAAGIEWQSLGYDQDWLVVDIVQSPEARLPLDTMQVCDPERLATYVCVKDPNRRWEFQLLPGETRKEMLEPSRIQALLDPWLPREHYEIRRSAVYQFHAATASRWRSGRVFLAGDSAHQTPPFLGQGLNSGFRDAVNLGWKLPLVHAGLCDDTLLDSYATERDAHARDLVEWAVALGRLMETLAAREAGRPDPYVSTDPSVGYGQGRTVPPLRQGLLVAEQVDVASSTGDQLTQPTVATRDGLECRLDDLLGPGFALVGRRDTDLQLSGASRAVVKALDARLVCIDSLDVRVGAMDRLFGEHPAAIVRPDRYVFGVVDEGHSLDRLVSELAKGLALRA
jgi:3-(3-hydroxy-phenyl)propionate hydroxylase